MKKSSSSKSTKASKPPKTVEDYLAGVDGPARTTLQALRKTIKAAAPEATEGISYGIPTLKVDGRMLASFAAFTNHCSFFPGAVIQDFAEELKSYQTSKGTIRFAVDKPLPSTLVRKILKARIERIQRGKEVKRKA
jgi:uncharacterized protein YdhG (YjbR/CyaY superfamily)